MSSTHTRTEIVQSPGGLGFCGALFLVFLVLKLTGVVDWSWLWVTAPLWLGFVLVAAVVAILGLIIWVLER